MPDFQYQPPTGPLSGSEFERQTTRFFQQVQGAADAAQSTAIVARNTASEALERATAANLEYEGATASAAGTSGLVPPAAAGQANYVLCGDGEWRDIATLVAAASVKAEEGTS